MKKQIKLSHLLWSALILSIISVETQGIVRATEIEPETLSPQILSDNNEQPSQLETEAPATNSDINNISPHLKQADASEQQQDLPLVGGNDTTVPVSETNESSNINLLKNGDFTETAPKSGQWSDTSAQSWNAWIDKSKTQIDTTPTIAIDSQNQLNMGSQKEFRGVVHQTVTIDDSQKYHIHFDIKSQDKTGNAFIRLLGFEGKQQKQIWHSDMTTGTTDWHTVNGIFEPQKGINSVKLEIFYEKGKGQVAFRHIHFGIMEPPKEDTAILETESSISLPLHKKHVLHSDRYHYELVNTDYASLSGAIILPKSVGQTVLKVLNQSGELVKTIQLTVTPASNTYSELIKTWNNAIAGNDLYDPKNPDMAKFHQELEKKVEHHLLLADEQKLLPEASEFAKTSSLLTSSYRKLEDMAKQVTNPHSIYYLDERVIRLVKNSMEQLYQQAYNEHKSISGNWWDYEIGAPRAINNILSLMYPYFSDNDIQKYTAPIEKFVPDPSYFRSTLPNSRFEALGGNLVDMGRVKVIAGILRQDAKEIADAVVSLSKLFTLTSSGEGFYEDGSYIAHTNVAYTGAYGNVLLDGLAQLLPVIQKSAVKLSQEKLAVIYQWIDKAFLPLIINGELMDMSRGRAISRATSEGHVAAVEALRGITLLADLFEQEKQLKLKTAVKSILKSDHFYRVYNNLRTYREFTAIKNLLTDTKIPIIEQPSHITTFNHMDKLAMYNAKKGFGFALSMHSNRTQNYEAMNNENVRGWYTGDGMFYLYNSDLGHYSQNYWATVNPYYLPGTTETTEKRADATQDLVKTDFSKTGQATLPSSFVGSLALDQYHALASMVFSNWNKTLSAKKSWTILNDKIVFLGSDIQNNSSERAYTTIEQRKETTPYFVYINGKQVLVSQEKVALPETTSIFLEKPENGQNIGYLFFKPTQITISRKQQEGNWKNINHAQTDQQVSNSFLTIQQEHHHPHDAYAYIMVPNIDKETFDKLRSQLNVQLLNNDANEQVIYDVEQKVWTITKYDDDKRTVANHFTLQEPGLYLIKQLDDNSYTGKFYNPITMQTHNISDKVQFLLPETPKEEAPQSPSLPTDNKENYTIFLRTDKGITESAFRGAPDDLQKKLAEHISTYKERHYSYVNQFIHGNRILLDFYKEKYLLIVKTGEKDSSQAVEIPFYNKEAVEAEIKRLKTNAPDFIVTRTEVAKSEGYCIMLTFTKKPSQLENKMSHLHKTTSEQFTEKTDSPEVEPPSLHLVKSDNLLLQKQPIVATGIATHLSQKSLPHTGEQTSWISLIGLNLISLLGFFKIRKDRD
ncbi:polysaccharide lyase family 8 super-sandwich domain-containing protein [Streptococcus ovuberis]|uniref:LPXTG cell wall anchor domain-containing protein n=1 Tax=Streptococcus ovuberis TaxID=1936207 RepID=A0A7X6MYD7_9STRE|nr:polysaccharide lyase family 8 super-sandwich domain-containing protein [Streptococcus ovuberis]NKZ20665.1 LPXTG cell wall anchor domain-containing protein [Streptococcus ovuberis]